MPTGQESYAWPAFGLPKPLRAGWQRTTDGAWVCQVSQSAYGHRARKRTWLYYVGEQPIEMNWGEPSPTAQVSFCKNHGNSPLPRLSKKEAKATPIAFRDALLALVRAGHYSRQKVA